MDLLAIYHQRDLMSLHASEADRAFKKLQMEIRDTKDRHAFFSYCGKLILKTRRSLGSGKIDDSVQHLIRQQLKLSQRQFADLIDCDLEYEGYVEILRTKGLIPPDVRHKEYQT